MDTGASGGGTVMWLISNCVAFCDVIETRLQERLGLRFTSPMAATGAPKVLPPITAQRLGPEPPRKKTFVTLVSGGDNPQEFVLEREAAEHSRMLRQQIRALSAISTMENGEEGEPPAMLRIELEDFAPDVLAIVVHFLVVKRLTGEGAATGEGKPIAGSLSDFDPLLALDPTSEEDQRLVVEVMLAADYLDC